METEQVDAAQVARAPERRTQSRRAGGGAWGHGGPAGTRPPMAPGDRPWGRDQHRVKRGRCPQLRLRPPGGPSTAPSPPASGGGVQRVRGAGGAGAGAGFSAQEGPEEASPEELLLKPGSEGLGAGKSSRRRHTPAGGPVRPRARPLTFQTVTSPPNVLREGGPGRQGPPKVTAPAPPSASAAALRLGPSSSGGASRQLLWPPRR